MTHELSLGARSVYAACTAQSGQDVIGLADRLGLTSIEVGEALAELIELDLVSLDPSGNVIAAPPGPALARRADRHERMATRARALGDELDHLWRELHPGREYVTVVRSDNAVGDLLARVSTARASVDSLQVGSVARRTIRTPAPDPVPGFFEAIARGVQFRVVYGTGVLNDPVALASVQACIRAGEQARVHAHVPVNLILSDRTRGLLIYPGDDRERRHALVIEESGLLQRMQALFDIYWQMSVPMSLDDSVTDDDGDADGHAASGGAGRGIDRGHRQVLSYLLAGLTDAAIARDLGLSERTVRRRIEALQRQSGAQTRFQLGVYAVQQGWLDTGR